MTPYYYGDAAPEDLKAEFKDRDYSAEFNAFWVPDTARWESLLASAKQVDIGKRIDDAVTLIEAENPTLKGILDKRHARAQLPESKLGGPFYTPASIVKTLVAILSPHSGKVYDPCCGSGGMVVQSDKSANTMLSLYSAAPDWKLANGIQRSIYSQVRNLAAKSARFILMKYGSHVFELTDCCAMSPPPASIRPCSAQPDTGGVAQSSGHFSPSSALQRNLAIDDTTTAINTAPSRMRGADLC